MMTHSDKQWLVGGAPRTYHLYRPKWCHIILKRGFQRVGELGEVLLRKHLAERVILMSTV